jgi:hypothetical protein
VREVTAQSWRNLWLAAKALGLDIDATEDQIDKILSHISRER